ncbi:MAG: FAD:protein FMN transferase [Puniceicoccales bacterium]|jgi:thiamine biosynthesis lipoprotein|nr:FAD:protein FMN transferase [Puniceicoccales bacterium]
MSDGTDSKKSLQYGHEAMNTDFTIFIADAEPDYAASAAAAAFDVLDRIEGFLSRFVASSDVSKVNALAAGDSYQLGAEAWACLLVAAQMAAETGRAFDPSAGALIDFWQKFADRLPVAFDYEQSPEWQAAWAAHSTGEFALEPESRVLSCVTRGGVLDLGAIGKGFALDEMARVIEEDWELSHVLLSAGGSTVLALDAPDGKAGWKIGFGGETRLPIAVLTRRALSSSGTQSQPTHLVDPRTGALVTRSDLVRAVAPSGAMADALSTAFFVMSREEVEQYCGATPERLALLVRDGTDGVPESFDVLGQQADIDWVEQGEGAA